jgi:hypothetical protein
MFNPKSLNLNTLRIQYGSLESYLYSSSAFSTASLWKSAWKANWKEIGNFQAFYQSFTKTHWKFSIVKHGKLEKFFEGITWETRNFQEPGKESARLHLGIFYTRTSN